jgi:hypothetical protein
MLKRIGEASPSLKARVAGGLFLLVIITAAFTQFFVRGRLGFAADLSVGLIEVSGMIAVTLLFYDIFKVVNRTISLLAASFNFLALIFELLQLIPRGVFIGIGFHGLYCFDRLPHLRGDLPAPIFGRIDGVGRFVLAGLSVTDAHNTAVSLRAGLGHAGRSFGVSVVPRDGRERSTMEGTG